MSARILLYVQHLMGVGHQMRAAAISRELVKIGFSVTYVSGGFSVPGLDVGGATFVQLPPCRAENSSFQTLVNENYEPIDAQWKESRKELLLDLYAQIEPNILITETFPFGRRLMRFELDPLIELAVQAVPKPLIVASIRDIMEPKSKPERYDEILDKVERWYDAILVHGDENLIPLEATVPIVHAFRSKIYYTGYVGERNLPVDSSEGENEVVITAGSGRVGLSLLETAILAKPLSAFSNNHWRILVGSGLSNSQFEALVTKAGNGITVERHRTDYLSLLRNCAASVSRAGYNTVMDILIERPKAVLVPFATPQETEQLTRARLLAERGLAQLVEEPKMNPPALAKAIDAAYATEPASTLNLQTNGAAETAQILKKLHNIQVRRIRHK
jgi:predicted glycosyltransferase